MDEVSGRRPPACSCGWALSRVNQLEEWQLLITNIFRATWLPRGRGG